MGRKDRARAERTEPTFSRPAVREERASSYGGNGWGAYLGGGGAGSAAGWAAENLASVLGAVSLISSSVSALPASIVVDGDAGPEAAPSSLPAARLLRRPAPAYSWSRWAEATTASLLLHGNALSYVSLDGRGAPVGLLPVPWGWCVPSVLSSGRLVYDVLQATPEARALGIPSGRLLDSDVMHVRARADGGGLIGRSVLSRARQVIEEGRELSRVAEAAWRQSARPSGWLLSERILSEGQRERATALIAEFEGALNTGRVPLLEDNWKFQQQTFNSVDAEFLASRAFSVAEVARIFCIPEPMLQVGRTAVPDLSPYLSAFATLALSPIITAIEDEFTYSVLPSGYRLQIDMGGLMRGSWSSLVAGAAAARMAGMLTANDGRALLGLPPRADGDTLTATASPAHFAADGPGLPHLGASPGATGDGLSAPGTNGNAGAG